MTMRSPNQVLGALGARGVTNRGGSGEGYKLVITSSDGKLPSTLTDGAYAPPNTRTYFVDYDMGDDADSGSVTNPMKTIQAALDRNADGGAGTPAVVVLYPRASGSYAGFTLGAARTGQTAITLMAAAKGQSISVGDIFLGAEIGDLALTLDGVSVSSVNTTYASIRLLLSLLGGGTAANTNVANATADPGLVTIYPGSADPVDIGHALPRAFAAEARYTDYPAATPADWPVQPTQTADAIDKLAARSEVTASALVALDAREAGHYAAVVAAVSGVASDVSDLTGSVDDLDDRVSALEGTGDTLTTVIYCDSGRTDPYTPSGSIFKPYKSLAAAAAAVPEGATCLIRLAGGTYAATGLPDDVSLEGCPGTVIIGAQLMGAGVVSVRNLTIQGPGALVSGATGNFILDHVSVIGSITIDAADVWMDRVMVSTVVGTALVLRATNSVTIADSHFMSADASQAAVNCGLSTASIGMRGCTVTGYGSSLPAMLAGTGAVVLSGCAIINSGTGDALDINNIEPNAVSALTTRGTCVFHASSVMVDGIMRLDRSAATNDCTGTALLYRRTGQIESRANDDGSGAQVRTGVTYPVPGETLTTTLDKLGTTDGIYNASAQAPLGGTLTAVLNNLSLFRAISVKTTDYAIPIEQCDSRYFTQFDAPGDVLFTLPSLASYGSRGPIVGFLCEPPSLDNAYLRIAPQPGERIFLTGAGVGDGMQTNNVGATVLLKGTPRGWYLLSFGNWVVG